MNNGLLNRKQIMQAEAEGQELRSVLKDQGFEHLDRLVLFREASSGNESAQKIIKEALDVAKQRLSSPPSPER
jgi:hypothetical protein